MPGLGEDRRGDAERGGDDDRGDGVRQQVPEHDPAVAGPETARGFDELLLFERERVGADDAGDGQPADQPEPDVDADQPAGRAYRPQAMYSQNAGRVAVRGCRAGRS